MSKTKTTLKPYSIYAQIYVYSAITVRADNLENAVLKARDLTLEDFVDIYGDYLDSTFFITGAVMNDDLVVIKS